MTVSVRQALRDDAEWLAERFAADWGDETIVLNGVSRRLTDMRCLVAVAGNARQGYLVYDQQGDRTEIVALAATEPGRSAGRLLIDALDHLVGGRLWLVTTNDNLGAQRFYERLGFTTVEVRRGAVDRSRAVKPSIPLVGDAGVEIHDEIVMPRP